MSHITLFFSPLELPSFCLWQKKIVFQFHFSTAAFLQVLIHSTLHFSVRTTDLNSQRTYKTKLTGVIFIRGTFRGMAEIKGRAERHLGILYRNAERWEVSYLNR